jgi:hypothetical protein
LAENPDAAFERLAPLQLAQCRKRILGPQPPELFPHPAFPRSTPERLNETFEHQRHRILQVSRLIPGEPQPDQPGKAQLPNPPLFHPLFRENLNCDRAQNVRYGAAFRIASFGQASQLLVLFRIVLHFQKHILRRIGVLIERVSIRTGQHQLGCHLDDWFAAFGTTTASVNGIYRRSVFPLFAGACSE